MDTLAAALDSDIDLFTDAALDNPFPLYRTLRDIGPAVRLAKYGVWFVGRFADVKNMLGDWQTFSSAQGIGLNPTINAAWSNALICVDPPAHTQMRKYFSDRLGPRHLKPIEETIALRADELAERIMVRGEFDAAIDVAQDLPVNVIMDLIGWPAHVRSELLSMASGSFNACGPDNPRTRSAFPKLDAMMTMVARVYDEDSLTPGGFGSTVADAARRGEIPREAAIGLLAGYVVAAFDTTINSIASGMWLFAKHPEQWDIVRNDLTLIPSAFNEILRIESPVQNMTRVATRDVEMGEGAVIPQGARVVMGYGSANRDERHYANPDAFDVRRNPIDQVAFGGGNHACAGQGLARLEAYAVFKALARRGCRFALAGAPQRDLNNITRGFSHIPLRVI